MILTGHNQRAYHGEKIRERGTTLYFKRYGPPAQRGEMRRFQDLTHQEYVETIRGLLRPWPMWAARP